MNKTGGGFWKPKVTDSDTKILAIIQDQVEPLTNPYDSGAVYFKDDTSQAETNNLAQGSPKLDHYYQEIVIDDSQPEQYPSPAPTTDNVPRYLVPSTSFDSPKHGMDANKTGQEPSRVLTPCQRIVRKTKEVPTVQKKLKKPTSIAAYMRTYFKTNCQNACLERKKIMQDILHSKLHHQRQQQQHNMKMLILKQKLETLNKD